MEGICRRTVHNIIEQQEITVDVRTSGVTKTEIIRAIRRIKNNKTSGLDEIHSIYKY